MAGRCGCWPAIRVDRPGSRGSEPTTARDGQIRADGRQIGRHRAARLAVTESAANAPVLVLQADERGLRGWVAGAVDAKGAKVAIRLAGKDHEAIVDDGNTFEWKQSVRRNTAITASVVVGGKTLTARTTLLPAPQSTARPSSSSPIARPIVPATRSSSSRSSARCCPNGEFEPIRDPRCHGRSHESDTADARHAHEAARRRLRPRDRRVHVLRRRRARPLHAHGQRRREAVLRQCPRAARRVPQERRSG